METATATVRLGSSTELTTFIYNAKMKAYKIPKTKKEKVLNTNTSLGKLLSTKSNEFERNKAYPKV